MTSFREWPSDGGPHTPDSIGQALSGLVARDSAGLPVEGMLAAPAVSAVSGAWKVQVGRFVHVRNVSGSARFSGLSNAEQHDIGNASTIPVGQARIDRVAWNAGTGAIQVIPGVPGTSPAAPALGGLAPVLRVRVNAGDAQVVTAQITIDYVSTRLGDRTLVPFAWDTAKLTVVRSELEISAGWARLRFHVVRKSGGWVSGEVLGSAPAPYRPALVEFSPVSVTPVGPVGNVAMRPDGALYLYAASGNTVIGDVGWPF